jgi:hypothetical protein
MVEEREQIEELGKANFSLDRGLFCGLPRVLLCSRASLRNLILSWRRRPGKQGREGQRRSGWDMRNPGIPGWACRRRG